MKAGVLYRDRQIGVGTVPDQELFPRRCLVRSAHAGLCGTDLHIYRRELAM
jgi:threonine dehydrogenase-like Zn-dependent dehydrogenase